MLLARKLKKSKVTKQTTTSHEIEQSLDSNQRTWIPAFGAARPETEREMRLCMEGREMEIRKMEERHEMERREMERQMHFQMHRPMQRQMNGSLARPEIRREMELRKMEERHEMERRQMERETERQMERQMRLSKEQRPDCKTQ